MTQDEPLMEEREEVNLKNAMQMAGQAIKLAKEQKTQTAISKPAEITVYFGSMEVKYYCTNWQDIEKIFNEIMKAPWPKMAKKLEEEIEEIDKEIG